jgi:hypothetical protein
VTAAVGLHAHRRRGVRFAVADHRCRSRAIGRGGAPVTGAAVTGAGLSAGVGRARARAAGDRSGLPAGGAGTRHPGGDGAGARASDQRLGARRELRGAAPRAGCGGADDSPASDLADGAPTGR